MFRNYLKVAWRNLKKNRLFSLINIIGLGLALPFSLLSLIQVQSSFESDNFHPFPDRTYRIITTVKDNMGAKTRYASSPSMIARQCEESYPSIEKATFTVRDYEWNLNSGIKSLPVNTIYVEPSFFDMFGFTLLAGTIPIEPHTLLITEEKAKAFFGTTDVVGKVLSHPRYGDFKITGVLTPFKRNTQFRSDVMVSMATYDKISSDSDFTALSGYTYVLMKSTSNPNNLNAILTSLEKTINKQPAVEKEKIRMEFAMQKVTAVAPDFLDLKDNPYVDDITDLTLNFSFALGLLLLAAFNYINLTLARSLSRAKEVGVRKVTGALNSQLVTQFIFEAVLVALISLVFGYVVLRLMQQFSYVNWFAWEVDNDALLWISFILFTILIGIIAGIVPAKILSTFQPAKVLKGIGTPNGFGKMGLRNTLVVIQFVASSCFILIMATFFNQLKYMATDNSNFNRRNIYNVTVNDDFRLLQHDLNQNRNVKRIGLVSTPFGETTAQLPIRKNNQLENVTASYYAADANFVKNMNIPFVSGENLIESVSDSSSDFVLVNEQLLSALGMGSAAEATGKTFLINDNHEVRIQGVLSNFCYYTYQFTANPLVIQYNPAEFKVLSIETKNKVDPEIFKSEINSVWNKYFPHDELVFSDYQKELYDRYFPGKDMKFMGLFCVAMLVIALLGLLGIVTFQTEKRSKEIGIRRVIGAPVTSIVKELSKSFVKLTILSALIALPIGYIGSYWFLSLFAYTSGIEITMLIWLFIAIFSIALITIAIQSVHAALANPVNSLRSE